jgi:iron complex outermembrane recepter protein
VKPFATWNIHEDYGFHDFVQIGYASLEFGWYSGWEGDQVFTGWRAMVAMARLLFGIFVACALVAAQKAPDEKVIVTGSAYPVPFDSLSRTVVVLTRDDLSRLPVRSLPDALAYAASVDVMSRAPLGVQADISIRGSSFSQTLVLVDGVRINDSQTAHHNADFPVPLEDVDRIEVLCGAGSALYGADALGGTINIITRRPPERFRASISGGEYGLVSGSFGSAFSKGALDQSLSVSAARSSGFMYDRDFHSIAFRSRTAWRDRSTLAVSYLNKEFGANGFYGPAPSKEWTDQTMVTFEHRPGTQPGSGTRIQSYYRTHGDRFLYDIRTPGLFENRHRTHAVGGMIQSRWSIAQALSLSAGGEAGGDFISSSNLGSRSYGRTSGFGELQWKPAKPAVVSSGLRLDYYSNFGTAASPTLSAGWWLHPRARLRASVARAFRIPTFTELYYRDPNHEAVSSIRPESGWVAEAGWDFMPAGNWLGALNVFTRRERDVIDWIRSSPAEKWRTANIRRVRTRGVEISLERSFGSDARLGLRYAHLGNDAGRVDYLSKYVLDYVRHTGTAFVFLPLPYGLAHGQTLSCRERADGRRYCLWDARIERRFREFAVVVDFTNLLGSRYQEIAGVDMPGRWITAGLKYDFPRSTR